MRTQGTPPRQAYNAQAAVNDQQIVLAAEITVDAPDFGHLEPMLDTHPRASATPRHHRAAGGGARRRRLLAHPPDRRRSTSVGSRCSSRPTAACARANAPAGRTASIEQMRDKLATDRGRKLYAQRKITIEPVFGQIKYNRRIDRFMRRGRAAAQSEWRLVTATHNLLKLHSHWIANHRLTRRVGGPPIAFARRRHRPGSPLVPDFPTASVQSARPAPSRRRRSCSSTNRRPSGRGQLARCGRSARARGISFPSPIRIARLAALGSGNGASRYHSHTVARPFPAVRGTPRHARDLPRSSGRHDRP